MGDISDLKSVLDVLKCNMAELDRAISILENTREFKHSADKLKIAYTNIQSTIAELERTIAELESDIPAEQYAMQYARQDVVSCGLNPTSPWSTKPRSAAKFHKLTLTNGGESVQVVSCWQDKTTIYWTTLDGKNPNTEANGVQVYGELDYARLAKSVFDYTNELQMPQTLSLSCVYNTFVIMLQEGASVEPSIIAKHQVDRALVFHGVKKIVHDAHGVVYFRGEGLGFDTGVNSIAIKSATLISYEFA